LLSLIRKGTKKKESRRTKLLKLVFEN